VNRLAAKHEIIHSSWGAHPDVDYGSSAHLFIMVPVATSGSSELLANATSAKPRIAVFDDEPDFTRLVKECLKGDFHVVIPDSQLELSRLVSAGELDAVLLDIGLPDDNGISIAQGLRYFSDVPIVFLTGYSSEDMIVKGLNIGADDYVTKPFQPAVLLARIRNVLRRRAERPAAERRIISFGSVSFDVRQRMLRAAGEQRVPLTEKEAMILMILAEAGNAVVSRNDLFRQIHGRNWDQMSREIDVHVSHLRAKLVEICGSDNPLSSIRGVGYCLNLEQG
jgi:DNA-binding response OmpR family regulator